MLTPRIFILKITDRAGLPSCVETMSPETAHLMTSILKEVVQRGTARLARGLDRPVAGKTGTTSDLMANIDERPETVARHRKSPL